MRLLLTTAATVFTLAACGRAAAPPTVATVAPAPTVGAPIPSATGAPAPTVQASTVAPSAATSPTSAERAAFVTRLRAISPALVTGDVNARIDEGVSLCAGITGNDPAQEVIVNTAIAFNVSLGDAAKIATAVRDTLCQ